jgi:hypothetical protein
LNEFFDVLVRFGDFFHDFFKISKFFVQNFSDEPTLDADRESSVVGVEVLSRISWVVPETKISAVPGLVKVNGRYC